MLRSRDLKVRLSAIPRWASKPNQSLNFFCRPLRLVEGYGGRWCGSTYVLQKLLWQHWEMEQRQGDQSVCELSNLRSGADGLTKAGAGPTLERTSNVGTGSSLLLGMSLSSDCFPRWYDKDLSSTCLVIFRLILRRQPGTFHPTPHLLLLMWTCHRFLTLSDLPAVNISMKAPQHLDTAWLPFGFWCP